MKYTNKAKLMRGEVVKTKYCWTATVNGQRYSVPVGRYPSARLWRDTIRVQQTEANSFNTAPENCPEKLADKKIFCEYTPDQKVTDWRCQSCGCCSDRGAAGFWCKLFKMRVAYKGSCNRHGRKT